MENRKVMSENRKEMSNLYKRFPELPIEMFNVNLVPIVIGVIGRGATQEAIDYCVNDLMEHGFEMWANSLNFYKELYGYTADPNECTNCGQVKDVSLSL